RPPGRGFAAARSYPAQSWSASHPQEPQPRVRTATPMPATAPEPSTLLPASKSVLRSPQLPSAIPRSLDGLQDTDCSNVSSPAAPETSSDRLEQRPATRSRRPAPAALSAPSRTPAKNSPSSPVRGSPTLCAENS